MSTRLYTGSTAGIGKALLNRLLNTNVSHSPILATLMYVHKHKGIWIMGLKYNAINFGVA